MPAPAPKLPKEPSKLYSVRLTESVVARSDRLLEPDAYTRLTPEMQRVMTSRAAIFRECLLRGLAAFEADLALAPMQLKRARRR